MIETLSTMSGAEWAWLVAGTLPNLGSLAYFAFCWEPGR